MSRAIRNGRGETSSRIEATLRQRSQRTLVLERISFRRSSAAAVRRHLQRTGMKSLHLILIFSLYATVGCYTNPTFPEALKHSSLPVSDSVEVPILFPIPNSSSAEAISWMPCLRARTYELEQSMKGIWVLVYVGGETQYPVTAGVFRIRAVYSIAVSRWSDSLNVSLGGRHL